ncbi:MAG: hypothetical protein OQK78_10065 [Gammaproteobacteria bacterium]|nr:hypothetical protein [Gammaproteobacteria bacterium]
MLWASTIFADEAQNPTGEEFYQQQYYEEALPLLEKAYQTTQSLHFARLLGHTTYHLLRYRQAADLLSLVVEEEPADIESRLLLSDSLLILKEYSKAGSNLEYLKENAADNETTWVLSARLQVVNQNSQGAVDDYEKAARINPDKEAIFSVELLSLYMARGEEQKAVKYANRLIQSAPDAFEIAELKVRLNALKEQQRGYFGKKKRYAIDFGYMLEFDDYLLVEPDSRQATSGLERKADMRHVFTAKLSTNKPLKENRQLYGDVKLYQSSHNKRSEYNLSRQSLSAGIHMPLGQYGLRVPYRYSNSILNLESYNRSHSISPEIYLNYGKTGSIHGILKYQHNEYRDDVPLEEMRSGEQLGVELLYQNRFYRNLIRGRYMLTLLNNNSDGAHWDYREHRLASYFSYSPLKRYEAGLDLIVSRQAFRNLHSGYGVIRSDHSLSLLLSLSYRLDRRRELKVKGLWSDRHSNIDFYDYSRSISGIGLDWHF